jgi:23S rRNA (uracil1939-C5)-methyltransferase
MNDESTFELDLTTITYGGDALGRHEGRAIFVPDALPGERARVRVTEDKGRYARAEVLEILQSAPERVTPRCKHFGVCGGCHWQHADYEAQLRYKRDIVVDQLARIGAIRDALVPPTIPSPQPWAYRTHVTFHVRPEGRPAYVAREGRTLLPIEECHIIREPLLEMALEIHPHPPAPLLRREGEQIDVQSPSPLVERGWGEVNDFDPGAGGRLRLQVGSDPTERIANTGVVHYTLLGQTFQVTGGGFFQVNLPGAEALVRLVQEKLALTGSERVLELYSGVGLFTAFIAPHAKHVTAVESYPPAVADAAANLHRFSNIDLIEGTVEEALPELPGRFQAAVADPPRGGIPERALRALVRRGPRRFVYVSCDPATLARDCKFLTKNGYRLVEAQPVDMFPQTYHIETVALLER